MKDELISFNTAILAKEVGFDEYCTHYYIHKYGNSFEKLHGILEEFIVRDDDGYIIGNSKRKNSKGQPQIIIAPTQSLLQRWLRDVRNIYVCVLPFNPENNIQELHIYYKVNKEYRDSISTRDGTYEDVLETGLFEALTHLKEKS